MGSIVVKWSRFMSLLLLVICIGLPGCASSEAGEESESIQSPSPDATSPSDPDATSQKDGQASPECEGVTCDDGNPCTQDSCGRASATSRLCKGPTVTMKTRAHPWTPVRMVNA